jgi:CubicO group peptidase (beta-lactamase class C family)
MKSAAVLSLLFIFLFHSTLAALPSGQVWEEADSAIQTLIDSGSILGAQLVVGDADEVFHQRYFGVRSAHDKTPINGDTQFCIGSCSKPFTSVLMMTLVQDGNLTLDQTIEGWLPEFSSMETSSGHSSPTPSLRQLLSHRGGIYSQKVGMTKQQSRWIRDFTLSLEDAVKGIAKEPLLASPGETYAYSGAGYCVVGRVAEVVAKQPFELLLQERLCSPLQLSRTTYFPDSEDSNIATGSLAGKPNPTTPHLSEPFKLPLIGGSIYSTALDSGRFLQMILNRGSAGDNQMLSDKMFEAYVSPQVKGQGYGLGWSLRIKNGRTVGLSHSGSLASSRALFVVNLELNRYGVVLYTLQDPSQSNRASGAVSKVLNEVVTGDGK